MSTSGMHTPVTKAMARAVLPPGACRECVWVARHLAATEGTWGRHDYPCPNCGIRFDEVTIRDEYRRRGWIGSRTVLPLS